MEIRRTYVSWGNSVQNAFNTVSSPLREASDSDTPLSETETTTGAGAGAVTTNVKDTTMGTRHVAISFNFYFQIFN
jgi:hypothetical protein